MFFQWAKGLFQRNNGDKPFSSLGLSAWPGGADQPTGLADPDSQLRESLLQLAKVDGVERLVLLRADGGLFCGRNDGGREQFSKAIQMVISHGRRAARRLGLGAIESLTLECPEGSIVLAAGQSACAVQSGTPGNPERLLREMERLVGNSGRKK